MAFIEWTAADSVGIARFDEQHKQLFGMVNEIYDAMKAGKAGTILGDVLDRLVKYTLTHFKGEEELMARYSFDGLAAHRLEHQALVKQVADLQAKFHAGQVALSISVFPAPRPPRSRPIRTFCHDTGIKGRHKQAASL